MSEAKLNELTCSTCIHFGEIRTNLVGGCYTETACLAPITTEPPKDGMTKAKNLFVYKANKTGCCELHTENKDDKSPEGSTSSDCSTKL